MCQFIRKIVIYLTLHYFPCKLLNLHFSLCVSISPHPPSLLLSPSIQTRLLWQRIEIWFVCLLSGSVHPTRAIIIYKIAAYFQTSWNPAVFFYSLLLYWAKRFFVICSIQHYKKTSREHFLFLVLWYVSCQSYVHRTKKHPI